MITGTVTRDWSPIIHLTVVGSGGAKRQISAIVDTGFNDYLTLPPDLMADLEFPWQGIGRAELADGSEYLFDIHDGIVVWDRKRRPIPIYSMPAMPLAGMRLLKDHELKIVVQVDGDVAIRKLSE